MRAGCTLTGCDWRSASHFASALGLGVGGFGEALDGVEPPIPLPGDLGHRPGGLVEAVGVDPVEDLAALLSPADQPGLFEHDQVLGDGLAGEGDLARQRAGAGLTPWTRRSSTRRREGSAIAAHRSSSGSVLISFHP